jgi:membrane protein implicated in regulation of membrane protease activity
VPADIVLRGCYSSSDEGGYLLILLITALVCAALAFTIALPYGAAVALGASVIFGAASIALTGAWLAFAAERRTKPRKRQRSAVDEKQRKDRSDQLEPRTPPAV